MEVTDEKHNPEKDVYYTYTSMEDINDPVEDIYDEVVDIIPRKRTPKSSEVTDEKHDAEGLKTSQPPPKQNSKRKWMAAKFAAVGLAVAVIFFLFGFLSGMLVFKQESEQQNDDDFFKNTTTTKKTPKLEKDCPSDWSKFGKSCYKLFKKNMKWVEAESHCIEQGGHLASVHSEQEKDFILALVPSAPGGFWIGGSDREAEGEWIWSDCSPFRYSIWDSKNPNNWNNEEHCLLFTGAKKWNDGGCNGLRQFVCKISIFLRKL